MMICDCDNFVIEKASFSRVHSNIRNIFKIKQKNRKCIIYCTTAHKKRSFRDVHSYNGILITVNRFLDKSFIVINDRSLFFNNVKEKRSNIKLSVNP